MVQSIELLFDEDAEAAIRASWDVLAAAGLPSLASHTGETNRPHVTLTVTVESSFERAVEALRLLFDEWEPGEGLTAEVGSPILFGTSKGRWVLARQIVPSVPLLTLHSVVHGAARDLAPVIEQALPGRWTPHVTLARRIPADQLPSALGVLPLDPMPCRFVGARLWDSPSKTVTALA